MPSGLVSSAGGPAAQPPARQAEMPRALGAATEKEAGVFGS